MTATATENSGAARLNSVEANFKNAMTRLGKSLDGADEERRAAMIAEILKAIGDEEAPTLPDNAEAIEILTRHQHKERNYDSLLATFKRQAEESQRIYDSATSDDIRGVMTRRIDTLSYMTRIVDAARTIKPETRSFGCVRLPRNKVSGRNTGFEDIQFYNHTHTTDDPLHIARLLDYMVNPMPGDAPIEEITPGQVALIDSETGEWVQWIDGMQADTVIRRSRGRYRRAYR